MRLTVRVVAAPGAAEHRACMVRMRQRVREHNVYRWAGLLLGELARIPAPAAVVAGRA